MGRGQNPIIPPWIYGSDFEKDAKVPDESTPSGIPPLLKRTRGYSYTFPYYPPESIPAMAESAYVHAITTRWLTGGGEREILINRTIGNTGYVEVSIETYHRDPPYRYNWLQQGWHWVTYLVGEPGARRRRYPPVGEAYSERYLPEW